MTTFTLGTAIFHPRRLTSGTLYFTHTPRLQGHEKVQPDQQIFMWPRLPTTTCVKQERYCDDIGGFLGCRLSSARNRYHQKFVRLPEHVSSVVISLNQRAPNHSAVSTHCPSSQSCRARGRLLRWLHSSLGQPDRYRLSLERIAGAQGKPA